MAQNNSIQALVDTKVFKSSEVLAVFKSLCFSTLSNRLCKIGSARLLLWYFLALVVVLLSIFFGGCLTEI